MESKQFAKYGGKINPYMATGGYPGEKCPCGKDAKGNCIPCTAEQLQELLKKSQKGTLTDVKGMDKIGTIDQTDLYHSGTDPYGTKIKPGMTDQQWIDYLKYESPERKAKRLASYKNVPGTDKFLSVTNQTTLNGGDECPCGMDFIGNCNPCDNQTVKETNNPYIHPGDVYGQKQQGLNADWQFTPWQKISMGYNWGQYAGAKRYMPFRSRFNATYAEPSLVNPEQAIGDLKGAANAQTSSLNTLNPILRNAQASSIYGQEIDKTPGIRSQYENANAGITNQFRQYNNQLKNQETLTNLGFDQNYYQQSVEARKNFDNLRSFLSNQAMDETTKNVETNQTLAWNLLTLDNPAYGYNFKTGKGFRRPIDIRDIYSNYSSEGAFEAMAKKARELIDAGYPASVVSSLLRNNAMSKIGPYLGDVPTFGQLTGQKTQKKGGLVKRNPYRY